MILRSRLTKPLNYLSGTDEERFRMFYEVLKNLQVDVLMSICGGMVLHGFLIILNGFLIILIGIAFVNVIYPYLRQNGKNRRFFNELCQLKAQFNYLVQNKISYHSPLDMVYETN